MAVLVTDCQIKSGNGGNGDDSQLSGWLYTEGNKIFKSNGGCGDNMPLGPTPWGELLIEYLNQSD
jgi:hypothetical protein